MHAAGPKDRSRLEQFLSRPRNDRLPRDVAVIYDILEQTGAIEWARGAASALAAAAGDQLRRAYQGANEGPDLDFVRSLASYLIERDL
jgi:geranylgeranyl diphosphate synthase, type II